MSSPGGALVDERYPVDGPARVCVIQQAPGKARPWGESSRAYAPRRSPYPGGGDSEGAFVIGKGGGKFTRDGAATVVALGSGPALAVSGSARSTRGGVRNRRGTSGAQPLALCLCPAAYFVSPPRSLSKPPRAAANAKKVVLSTRTETTPYSSLHPLRSVQSSRPAVDICSRSQKKRQARLASLAVCVHFCKPARKAHDARGVQFGIGSVTSQYSRTTRALGTPRAPVRRAEGNDNASPKRFGRSLRRPQLP